MVKKFDEAADACDKAIDARAGIRYPARWYNSLMTHDRVRDKAMAYSNRGVLRAVNSDPAGARDDFAKAVSLRAQFDAPAINLARLENKMLQSLAAQQNER